jgi:hypothetical protein
MNLYYTVIDPPTLKIIPRFSCIDQTLTVDISFNKSVRSSTKLISQKVRLLFSQDAFNIADGYDGSASSYTITYSESASDEPCGTETIQASTCSGLTCVHTLKIKTPSPCLTSRGSVSITIFVTNAIGNGPASEPVVFIIPECDGHGSGKISYPQLQ